MFKKITIISILIFSVLAAMAMLATAPPGNSVQMSNEMVNNNFVSGKMTGTSTISGNNEVVSEFSMEKTSFCRDNEKSSQNDAVVSPASSVESGEEQINGLTFETSSQGYIGEYINSTEATVLKTVINGENSDFSVNQAANFRIDKVA